MSEQELQFHYFKMHDSDNNNKLDGCELIKSLIHWHGKLNFLLQHCAWYFFANGLFMFLFHIFYVKSNNTIKLCLVRDLNLTET